MMGDVTRYVFKVWMESDTPPSVDDPMAVGEALVGAMFPADAVVIFDSMDLTPVYPEAF